MKGWDERVAELKLRGRRVRDTFDRATEKAELARGWNAGETDTSGLANCELVKLTSGGREQDRRELRLGNLVAEAHAADGIGRPEPRECRIAGVVPSPLAKQCREGGAVNQPALDSARPHTATTSSAAPIRLPYPPSGNTAVRHANGAHYLRPEVTTYRQAVAVILGRSVPIQGRYELHVELSPPDARRRDIDNALKSLLDAMVKAGYLPDDSMAYMRKLTVVANDERRGDVVVRAVDAKEAA